MDAHYYTKNPVGHPEDQTKHGEQDLFASSDDVIKEGDTYGFPISILEDDSDKNKELGSSTAYSANSPAYSPTSPAYSPTSPVQLPESPTSAKPDNKWSNSSSSVPPEYYVNDYSKLVNVNQPGLTSMTTLITTIANEKNQQRMLSRHFATIGTPSQRLVINYAIDNIVVSSRTSLEPGIEWVNNFENFQVVVDAIKKFRIRPDYQATKVEMRAARDLKHFGWRLIPTHLTNDDIVQLNNCISIGLRILKDSKIRGSSSPANREAHLLSKHEPNRRKSC